MSGNEKVEASKPKLHTSISLVTSSEVTVDVTTSGEHTGKSDPPRQIPFNKKVLIVLMCTQTFITFLMYGIIAPFYPDVATGKGASVKEVNLVFSVQFLTSFLVSPVIGRYLPTLGGKFVYITGVYVRIVAEICFGFLVYAPDGAPFIVLSFVTRIFAAIGGASFNTATLAISSKEFPDRVTVMFGVLQTFVACGIMMGPPVGGVLYDIGASTVVGSYTFPFLCMTALGVVVTTINAFYLPSTDTTTTSTPVTTKDVSISDNNNKMKSNMRTLLANYHILVNVVAIGMASGPIIHTEISLEQHLDQFGLTPTLVGLVFTCESGVYAVFAIIWGWIDDQWFYPRLQLLVCGLIYALACLLIGPTPLFDRDTQLWLVIVALCLIGVGGSGIQTACFKGMLSTVLGMGMPNDFVTSSLVSGIYMGSFQLGGFIGPTAGGVMVDEFERAGYAWSMTIYAFMQVALISLPAVIMMCTDLTKTGKGSRNQEKVPLLTKD